MDQPESEQKALPQITCSIHNQPACALKCVDLETCLPVQCILCIIEEKINGKDLISILEIFNPNVKQVYSVLPHLSKEQLIKLKKIQSESPESMIATIESFFHSLKEEVIKKINEQEKIAIKQAYELIEKQEELKEKQLEFNSIKDLQDLISSNQSNPDLLNEELKKFFKEFYEIQQERKQEIQQLINNYENISFREDISNLLKKNILSRISQLIFFQVSSEDKSQENNEVSLKQQEFLELLVNSSKTLSQALTRSTSLFKQNEHEPLDFSFIDALIIEDRTQENCKNPKELLRETQYQVLTTLNSNKSANQILTVLKQLTTPQRLHTLSAIVQDLPTYFVLTKMLFKADISKCQFENSKFPQSKPIQSKLNLFKKTDIQNFFNSGFSSLYSDCVLDPKLKYKLEINFTCSSNTNDRCFIGLLPDNQKDEKLMSEYYALFPFIKNFLSQQSQKPLFCGNQPYVITFHHTIFICISEQIFFVCDEKGDIIDTIPNESIQSTTQYRIGIQFQNKPNLSQPSETNQISQVLFGNENNQGSRNLFSSNSQQSQVAPPQELDLNLTILSFQILNVFPLYCA